MELINKQLESLFKENVKTIFNIDSNIEIQNSNKKGFGDYATNFAMVTDPNASAFIFPDEIS